MDLRAGPEPPFVALRWIGRGHAAGHPPDVAVGIGNDGQRGDGGGALADDRQRHVGDLALRAVDLSAYRDERLVVLRAGEAEDDVAGARDRRAEGLVVLGSEHRVAVEDEVETDDERPAPADAVDELAVQRAGKRPLEAQLLEGRLVDRDDDDRRSRRTDAAKQEELVEPQVLPSLDWPQEHERQHEESGADAGKMLPELPRQTSPKAAHPATLCQGCPARYRDSPPRGLDRRRL